MKKMCMGAVALLAYIGMCNASTVVNFDQHGIDYPLTGGDVTLVPVAGIDMLFNRAPAKAS
jgi:hypothetical protein